MYDSFCKSTCACVVKSFSERIMMIQVSPPFAVNGVDRAYLINAFTNAHVITTSSYKSYQPDFFLR